MDDTPDIIITIADIQRAGFCPSGARRWFGEYGLDFRDMLNNGIPASALLATGDGLARQVVDRRIERDLLERVPDGLILTVDDLAASSKCRAGARDWAARHGYDFEQIRALGISARALVESGDPDARQIVIDRLARSDG